MSVPIRARTRTAAVRVLLAGLPLLAACSDTGTGNQLRQVEDLPLPRGTVAVLRCVAQVATASVNCEPGTPSGAAGQKNGPRATLRVMGGQGTYVRLTSSGNSYNVGTQVLSFNVTVQNLSTVAFGTADGATRDDDGVRVFFASGPTITAGPGDNPVTVLNHTGTDTYTASNQKYFQYGGKIAAVDQGELGADGMLATGEVSSTKNWQLGVPSAVTTFEFTLYVATETPAGAVASAAPQVTGVSPATLVPGSSATLTGTNFNAAFASNTVTIGGSTATVTGGNATSLTVTVPCTSSGSVPVTVATGGMKGASYSHPLQVTQRTVAVGQAVVTTSSAESFCNELPSANGAARYVVAVFSDNTSPASNSPFQFSADGEGAPAELAGARLPSAPDALVAPRLSLDQQFEQARARVADERHQDLMEKNRAAYERGRAEFPRGRAPRGMALNRDVVYGDPPATRQFRVSNISPPAGQTICSSFYVVNATRVYFNGKLAIYEDDATPAGLRYSDNPSMATYYQKIGDQFNADMEPVLHTNFGDVLRRDAETDNNGVEIALFTPRLNTSFSGVAGFVVSCDQFPNNDTTTTPRPAGGPYTGLNSSGGTASFGASNFGEFFYAYQPTINGTGFGTVGTPDYWYRTIRSTFIHESKHVVSMAARVANDAPTFEESWLEEGMARTSEEMWMRNAVDNVAWKANTGYGSFANPVNLYCDVRPGFAECDANTRRPASIMQRHFTSLNTNMLSTNARLLSPFGATASDTQSYWYATSWSLIRYSVDRYGASDAAFLTALTQSTTAGITNLTGRAGTTTDQLLGGWALSFAVDDYPGLASPSADTQQPTWNFRSIYAGLKADFPSTYPATYPLVPQARTFGSFAPVGVTTLRGGGVLWYEISGTQTAAQLLRLETNGGGQPSSSLRLAIARVQ